MSEGDPYDVIVIGTGAGGGTLAHTVAPAAMANGIRVGEHIAERSR